MKKRNSLGAITLGLLGIIGCKNTQQQELQPTLAETFITTQPVETTDVPQEKPIETQLEESYQSLPEETYQSLTQQYSTTEQKVQQLTEHIQNMHARTALKRHKSINPSFKLDNNSSHYRAEIKKLNKNGNSIFYTIDFYTLLPSHKEEAELIKKRLLKQGLSEKELNEKLYLSSIIITLTEEDTTNWFFDETADGLLERVTIKTVDYYRRNTKDFFQPCLTEKPLKEILNAKQIQNMYEKILDDILAVYSKNL